MSRTIGVIIVATVMIIMSGCTIDATRDRARAEAQQDDLGNSRNEDPLETTENATSEDARSEDDVATLTSGCSIVEFCNVPNSSDGTRCRQQGCSLQNAEKECKTESQTVCGGHVCPWIFVASNGQRFDLCAANSCVGQNACGGQAPAGCFCDSACTTFGDCCPDGPC